MVEQQTKRIKPLVVRFSLLWLASSFLTVGYVALAMKVAFLPNTVLEVVLWATWVGFAGWWLDAGAAKITTFRRLRWVFAALTLLALLVIALPWAGEVFLSVESADQIPPFFSYLTIFPKFHTLVSETIQAYQVGGVDVQQLPQVIAASLGLGLGLALLALCWRVTWRMVHAGQTVARFLLLWLASSLLIVGYVAREVQVTFLRSNILEALICIIWIVLAGRWLDTGAVKIATFRRLRLVCVVLTLLALLSITLPSVAIELLDIKSATQISPLFSYLSAFDGFYILVGRTIQAYQYGEVDTQRLSQVSAASLGLGLGVALLALSWRVMWRMLLTIPVIAARWQQLGSAVHRAWSRLRHSRAWPWLQRGMWGSVGLLLLLDLVGVLLTVLPAPKWEYIPTTGFPQGRSHTVQSLAFDAEGGNLYAGTEEGGVFRKEAGRDAWQPVNEGLNDFNVPLLAPGDHRLYAKTASGDVFRLDEGKDAWQAITYNLSGMTTTIQTLAVGPNETLYAGMDDGLFRLEDGGESWQPVDQGLTNRNVRALATDGEKTTLYAGTAGGVFCLDDGAWRPITRGLTITDVTALAVTPGSGGVYAGTSAGVFRLAKDGAWHTWKLEGTYIRSLAAHPDGKGLYAGTRESVFYLDSDSVPWQTLDRDLGNLNIKALAVGAEGVFAGTTEHGVYRLPASASQDMQGSWEAVNQGLAAIDVFALAVGPGGKGVYAGAAGDQTTWSGGIFRLDDKEPSWQVCNQGLTNMDVLALQVGPGDNALYAGTVGGGIFRSDDQGATWYTVNQGLTGLDVWSLVVGTEDICGGQCLFAGMRWNGVFRSDDGYTWYEVNQGLTTTQGATVRFAWTLIVGSEGKSLYVGTQDGGVYRSDDGKSWREMNAGLTTTEVRALAVGPDGKTLYAGTEGGGAFRWDDNGEAWTPLNQGLGNLKVWTLSVGPDKTRLYAGTWGGGVFYLENDSVSWQPLNRGLGNLIVVRAMLGPGQKDLYVGTQGGGVFRLDESGAVWYAVNDGLSSLNITDLVMDSEHTLFAETQAGVFYSAAESQGKTWKPIAQIPADFSPSRPHTQTQSLADRLFSPPPDVIDLEAGMATAYTSFGAAMVSRYTGRAPLILRTPPLYQGMVEKTLRVLDSIADDSVLAVGLGVFGAFALYVYAGVMLPNQLRARTVMRLLPHPRLLLAAPGYRNYAQRWTTGDALEQLIPFQIPLEGALTQPQLESALRAVGAAFDAVRLHTALNTLAQRGLLRPSGGWQLSEPALASILRLVQPADIVSRLATQSRNEHPLYANTRRFLEQASFEVTPVEGQLAFRCVPTRPDMQRLLPPVVYTRVLLDEVLDSEWVFTIYKEVHTLNAAASAAFVVTDQRPTNQGWAQIGTLQMEGFTVLPVAQSLIHRGLAEGRERAMLQAEVEKRLGEDYDPYDTRDPVADALSFFGRDALLGDLLRRITEGRPVGIFGLRKLGKSSLLQALCDHATFPIAPVNLQTIGSGAAVEELYLRILRYWQQWARMRCDLVWELPTFDSGDVTGAFTSATMDLLRHIEARRGEARLGLFLDEAELIVPRPDGGGPDRGRYLTFIRALRGLVDEDGRLSLVVASLNPSINRINSWEGEQNPTFNLFQEIYLPPLAREDCMQMVCNIGQQVSLRYDDASVEAIVELSGGHPFLARQLCSLLYRLRDHQPGTITVDAFPAAVEHFIYDIQTVTHLDAGIWQDAGNAALWGEAQAQANQAILLALAQAEEPLSKEVLLNAPDADVRRAALIDLERFHFICPVESGAYTLRYGLFRTWLRRRRLGLE